MRAPSAAVAPPLGCPLMCVCVCRAMGVDPVVEDGEEVAGEEVEEDVE